MPCHATASVAVVDFEQALRATDLGRTFDLDDDLIGVLDVPDICIEGWCKQFGPVF